MSPRPPATDGFMGNATIGRPLRRYLQQSYGTSDPRRPVRSTGEGANGRQGLFKQGGTPFLGLSLLSLLSPRFHPADTAAARAVGIQSVRGGPPVDAAAARAVGIQPVRGGPPADAKAYEISSAITYPGVSPHTALYQQTPLGQSTGSAARQRIRLPGAHVGQASRGRIHIGTPRPTGPLAGHRPRDLVGQRQHHQAVLGRAPALRFRRRGRRASASAQLRRALSWLRRGLGPLRRALRLLHLLRVRSRLGLSIQMLSSRLLRWLYIVPSVLTFWSGRSVDTLLAAGECLGYEAQSVVLYPVEDCTYLDHTLESKFTSHYRPRSDTYLPGRDGCVSPPLAPRKKSG